MQLQTTMSTLVLMEVRRSGGRITLNKDLKEFLKLKSSHQGDGEKYKNFHF